MQRATAQRMNQALPRALCSLFPAASRALTWRAHERERYNSRRRKERRRLARWRAREGRRRTRATTERKRWSFFFSFTRARFLSVFFFDNFESVTHPLFSNTSFFFPLLARSTPPSFNKSCSQMASLRPSLGASRVGSCIGRGGKAVSRVVVALPPTPLGRQTTNAVVVASSPSSASSSLRPLRDAPDAPGARRQTARQQWLGLDAGAKALAPPPPGRRECFGRVCFGVGAVVRANIVVGARRRQRRRFRALWLFRRRALRPRR
jgi:hypothetical protein